MIELTKLTILEPFGEIDNRFFSMISILLDGEVYCSSVTLTGEQLLELYMGSSDADKAVGMYLIQELIESIPEEKQTEARAFFYDN